MPHSDSRAAARPSLRVGDLHAIGDLQAVGDAHAEVLPKNLPRVGGSLRAASEKKLSSRGVSTHSGDEIGVIVPSERRRPRREVGETISRR